MTARWIALDKELMNESSQQTFASKWRVQDNSISGGDGDYSFDASSMQIYDVLSVTRHPATALQLLEIGVRDRKNALAFLQAINMHDLIGDNTEFVRSLVARGISSDNAFKCLLRPEFYGHPLDISPTLVADAVEFSLWREEPAVSAVHAELVQKILAGSIRFSDVQEVGAEQLTGSKHLAIFVHPLEELASQQANFTASDLGDVLDKLKPFKSLPEIRYVIDLLRVRGVEDTLSTNISAFTQHIELLHEGGAKDEDSLLDGAYYLAILSGRIWNLSTAAHSRVRQHNFIRKHYSELLEHSIPPDVVVPLIIRGLTFYQILKVAEGGTNAAIANGAL